MRDSFLGRGSRPSKNRTFLTSASTYADNRTPLTCTRSRQEQLSYPQLGSTLWTWLPIWLKSFGSEPRKQERTSTSAATSPPIISTTSHFRSWRARYKSTLTAQPARIAAATQSFPLIELKSRESHNTWVSQKTRSSASTRIPIQMPLPCEPYEAQRRVARFWITTAV